MRQLEKGMFARSLAGHDKGRLYIIAGTEDKGSRILVADGVHHTVDRPKAKKRMHIQPDYHIDPELKEKTERNLKITDADIRAAIHTKEEKSDVKNRCN
ncbi:MAG: KOW domain-containing RNA-binding protein [Lachnospiraceae bacterium]|nr:KOW domain-containing RNA-binding protein [Lachnospiraceae bacterium]